jgi:hypothetical protein
VWRAAPHAGFRIAELAQRLRARSVLGHARFDQIRGAHLDVKLELVTDVGADVRAAARWETKQAADAPRLHGDLAESFRPTSEHESRRRSRCSD